MALRKLSILFVALAACTKAPDNSGDAGSDPTNNPSNPSGSGGKGGGNGGAGGSIAAADGGAQGNKSAFADFEGIDDSKVLYGNAPAGCVDKANASADTVTIQLNAKITSFVLSSVKGVLQVNDVICTAKKPTTLKIIGTSAPDTIIIDFSKGDFPDSLKAGTIAIDGGGGKDTIAIAGTRDTDDIHIGSINTNASLRIGASQPLVTIATVEGLIISAGPGADAIDATGGTGLGGVLNVAVSEYGGADSDNLIGGTGADSIFGGDGDDMLRTGATADGADLYDGGDGDDTMTYELRTASLTLKLDNAANDGEMNERDNIQNVETLIGGAGDDTITGGDGDDTLIGGPGNDHLNGGKGDDTFVETASAQGTDVMNGGPGSDTVDYSDRTKDMMLTLCLGSPESCAIGSCGCSGDDGEADELDTLVNIENATTGGGNDHIVGSSADNLLRGGDGDDTLEGLAGNDQLYGEGGDDILLGGAGDDVLVGGDGVNTFDGGDDQGDICITHGVEVPLNCELH